MGPLQNLHRMCTGHQGSQFVSLPQSLLQNTVNKLINKRSEIVLLTVIAVCSGLMRCLLNKVQGCEFICISVYFVSSRLMGQSAIRRQRIVRCGVQCSARVNLIRWQW